MTKEKIEANDDHASDRASPQAAAAGAAPPATLGSHLGPAKLAHDVFRHGGHALDPLFHPRSVAVVGASETPRSVGRTLFANLLATSFGGPVYPVNPKRPSVLGHQAFKSLSEIEGPVDLAVIATPAATVPAVVVECVARGVPAGIVISAGFRETGAAGAALEQEIRAIARRGNIRLVGPNCLGVMSPPSGLNATFAAAMARPGHVACLSQSGALLTAILDWSLREHVGFSAMVSLGSMLDVDWSELLDYFGNDARTRAIVMYMETIGDARAFLSAAREVALTKPIILIKPGRSDAGSRAARSHTGALTGADDVLDAAFRRCGVLRVNDIAEVFALADVLDKQPRARGPRLAIVTNAGGPGVLATDALIAGGGELTPLSADTLANLNQVMPSAWSHGNPIDILGDADPERYAVALTAAAADPASDGLLAILTPQDMTDPTAIASALAARATGTGKPVLASWMGGQQVAAGVEILNRGRVPTFEFPDEAARAFCAMWRYADNLRGLYETPALPPGQAQRPEPARALLAGVLATGRTLLDEAESKALLECHGIPTVPTRVARDEAAAVTAARELGYPVAVKIWSHTVTHKRAAGGVKLGVTDDAAVVRAFREIQTAVVAHAGADSFLGVTVQPFVEAPSGIELILGAAPDAQLGPVLLFGTGGSLVEVFRDRALGLPPLTVTLARRLIAETRIYRGLARRATAPIDWDALANLLVRFADLVVAHPRIRELDINPLLATPTGLLALDARVVLYDPSVPDAELPRPAIRPYPTEYILDAALPDGTPVTIRPIRPEDEPRVIAFHATLSDRSVWMRYMQALPLKTRTDHTRLIRVCFTDYDRELAFVVERRDGGSTGRDSGGGDAGARREILAIGRLSRERAGQGPAAPQAAEFSLLISDPWQGRGIGRLLLGRLLDVARDEGWALVYADILRSNLRMQRVCASLGFTIDDRGDSDVVRADWRAPTPTAHPAITTPAL